MSDRLRSTLFRFLKGAVATAIAAVIGYAAGFVPELGLAPAITAPIVGAILAAEKYLRWE